MAFPTLVSSRKTQETSAASTTHNILMPTTVNAGNTILMMGCFDRKLTYNNVTPPTGWNGHYLFGQDAQPANTSWTMWTAVIQSAAGNEAGTSKTVTTGGVSTFGAFQTVVLDGVTSFQFGSANAAQCCPPVPQAYQAQAAGPRDMFVVDFWARNSNTWPSGITINNWNQYTQIQTPASSGICNTALNYPYKNTAQVGAAYKTYTAASTTYSGDETTQVVRNAFLVYDGQGTGQPWGGIPSPAWNKKCNPQAQAISMQIAFYA